MKTLHRFCLALALLLLAVRPAAEAGTFSESFNKANAATLGPDLTWTEVTGTSWGVTSNQATVQAASDDSHARADHDTVTSNQFVEATIAAITEGGGGFAVGGIACRFSSSADTSYVFQARLSNSGDDFSLRAWVNGVESAQIGATISQVPTVGDVMRLECDGSTLRAYIDGVLVATETDTSVSSGTRAGLRGIITGSSTLAFDTFSFGDLTAAGPLVHSTPLKSLVGGGLVQ